MVLPFVVCLSVGLCGGTNDLGAVAKVAGGRNGQVGLQQPLAQGLVAP